MRLAEAIRQPALLRSEAMLLPALPTENVRAALSQLKAKDKNIKVDQTTFRPVEPASSVAVRAGRNNALIQQAGSIAGRGILRQVGAPYGVAVPTVAQSVFSRSPAATQVAAMLGTGAAQT